MDTARTPLIESRRSKRSDCEVQSPTPKILQDFVTTREENLQECSDRAECDVGVDKPKLSSPSRSERQLPTATGNRLEINEAVRSPSLTQRHQDQSVLLSHEDVTNLIITLESTADSLKQLIEIHCEPPTRKSYKFPSWLTNNLFPITLTWQALNLMAMSIMKACDNEKEKTLFFISIAVLVIFQLTNLIVVIMTTVKLTKQVMHQTVTKSFLGQSYLSTILLYAGLYTLLYNVQSDAFENTKVSNNVFGPWELYAKMLFFSVSTATLCGASSVCPKEWYVELVTGTQMLMSYVYFASVLFMAVHPPKKQIRCRMDKSRNSFVKSV